MKTGPHALGTAENESKSAKHENGTRRPGYRRKRVQERCVTLFRALRTAFLWCWRWDAEEGHGDPS
jgi:hypothetical protein